MIGLAAGVLSGVFGIGGGILIVPALGFLLGFSQLKAQGTSLVALLAPVGILALMQYAKKGEVDLKVGLIIAAGFFAGAFFGSKIALNLNEVVMRRSFAGFLVLVAVMLFMKK